MVARPDGMWAGTAVERPAVVGVYFGLAHLALAAMGAVVAARPDAFERSAAHPVAVACAHLLALGWITSSILGATYLVLPLALGARLRAGAADAAVAAGFAAGATAIAGMMATGRYELVGWPAGLGALALAWVGARATRALVGSKAPAAISAHVAAAYACALLAAALAVALARGWLPVARDRAVAAHVHLAAAGFAVTMAIGVGHRLLPMFLPAAPRSRRWQWATLLVPMGAVLLASAALAAPALVLPAAMLVVAGIAVFAGGVLGLLRDRRPPPRELPRPDVGRAQILLAVASLVCAAGIGLYLAAADSPPRPRLVLAYGVLGLLGFLGQLVAGIGLRLLPTFLWAWAWRGSAATGAVPAVPPVRMPSRLLAWLGLLGLAGGTLALAAGAGTPHLGWIRAGGLGVLLGASALLGNALTSARRARAARPASGAGAAGAARC